MIRIILFLFSFFCFITSANATWVVKELEDNQISVYVKGEQNPDHKIETAKLGFNDAIEVLEKIF